MTVDLLLNPRCRAEHLGLPMPDSPHAVSACLPLWQHNVGYEEGDLSIIDQLQAAYPRFCLHPLVRRLIQQSCESAERSGYVFPSIRAAQRARDYFMSRGGQSASLIPVPEQQAVAVQVPLADLALLREYWQHAGEVLSSRAAELILKGHPATRSETEARRMVRRRIALLQGVSESEVYLFPSGMAAMAEAWRLARGEDTAAPSVQFGFPYVDTLKMQQRFPPGICHFFPRGDSDDLQVLSDSLKQHPIRAVFCETPANPLLTCPDLKRLRELADEHNFLLIVDDTLAACLNLTVLPYADLVVTSLTKYFSGQGDVLAGSLVVNPNGPHFQQLQSRLSEQYEDLLFDADVEVLCQNSDDLAARVATINHNARSLAELLAQHPSVQQVWYPSLGQNQNYESLRKQDGGYGGLLSMELKNPAQTTAPFFDALEICKGPNLGTSFTLCCPYTILAHYTELDYVESCGVSRWLMRISVGIEPLEVLTRRFENALPRNT